MDMTPDEISNYKQRWLATSATAVQLSSAHDVECKDWCRRHLERQQWSFSAFTTASTHTFWFENESDAAMFKAQFMDWTG